jgi:hypothetical protein
MKALKTTRAALVGLIGVFAAMTAQAAPIVYSMSGVFDLYDQINGITLGQSTFSASYTYDPATGNASFPDSTTATYSPYRLTFSVPDLGLSLVDVPAPTGTLEVRNNFQTTPPMVADQFSSQAGAITTSLPASIAQLQTQFTLYDPSANAFSSTNPPTSLDLASFSNRWFQLNIVPTVLPPGPSSICAELGTGSGQCTANGTITALSVSTAGALPEPATIALVGLALAGLGVSRRRRLH